MRKFFKGLSTALAVCVCALLVVGTVVGESLPNDYQITKASGLRFHETLPISAKTEQGGQLVEAGILNTPNQNYEANLMLMDLIPIKQVNVQVVEETRVIPCGTPFGIKIFTEGVVVVGMADVKTDSANVNPAKEAGLKTGDVILSINGESVNTNEQVSKCIQNCGGQPLSMSVRRENMKFETQMIPVKSAADSSYKAGLWVRDSSAGIGTLTFMIRKSKCLQDWDMESAMWIPAS